MSAVYNISVTFEMHTPESVESGDAEDRGYEFEKEDFDIDGIKKLIREYGFCEPSSTSLSEKMWFSSTTPREDRAYFEKGESRYFSLHLHSVDGESPTLEDYADLARLTNAKVSGLENIGSRIDSSAEERTLAP